MADNFVGHNNESQRLVKLQAALGVCNKDDEIKIRNWRVNACVNELERKMRIICEDENAAFP